MRAIITLPPWTADALGIMLAGLARFVWWLSSTAQIWPVRRQRHAFQLGAVQFAFEIYRHEQQEATVCHLVPRYLALAEEVYGRESGAQRMRMKADFGALLVLHGHGADGEAMFAEALAWFQHHPPQDTRSWGGCLMDLGGSLLQLGRVEEAIPGLQQAEQIVRRVCGEQSPEFCQCQSNVGIAYQEAGCLPESAASLRLALAKQEARAGSHSVELVPSLNNLANTLRLMQQYDEAQQHIARALKIGRKYEDAAVPSCLDTLADIYEAQQKWREAELTRANAITQTYKSGAKRQAADWLEKQADLLERRGQASRAGEHREAAARVRRQEHFALSPIADRGGRA